MITLILIISFICFCMAFRTTQKERENDAGGMITNSSHLMFTEKVKTLICDLRALPCEFVSITASIDGTPLSARYYHQNDGAPVDILCHGYRGTAFRDFCGGHKLCRDMGHNILLIDQRAHGKSGGNTITFGIKERYDVLDWANYIAARFPNAPIMLYGISMGGATVLLSSELDLPKQVKGICADCPFSSPRAILKNTVKNMPFPQNLGYPFLFLASSVFGAFKLSKISAVDTTKNSKVPILIIHGEEDDFVPCDMSREIAKDNDKITLVTFKDATHGISYMTDTERYNNTVKAFCDKVL